MKKTFKMLSSFIITVCSCSSPTAAKEEQSQYVPFIKGTVAPNGYTCIADERPPFPDLDNPHKTLYTVLSKQFLEQRKKPTYEFPTTGTNLIEIGSYKIDRDMFLGSGDDGAVYLAKHSTTQIYAAAKFRRMVPYREDQHHEYQRLKTLGQLYAGWRINAEGDCFLITQFVDGIPIDQSSRSWLYTKLVGNYLEFSDLAAGFGLVKSLIQQLRYITSKGALHDQNFCNILVTNDYKSVVLIDFGDIYDYAGSVPILKPFDSQSFEVPVYSFCCHYLLDTSKFYKDLGEGKITGPSSIIKFLNNIVLGRHRSLKLDKFLEAFDIFEQELSREQIIDKNPNIGSLLLSATFEDVKFQRVA